MENEWIKQSDKYKENMREIQSKYMDSVSAEKNSYFLARFEWKSYIFIFLYIVRHESFWQIE